MLDEEAAYLLTYGEAQLVFAEDEEQVDKLLGLADRAPHLKHIVYSDPRGMGWGTADTEALTGFVAQDKIPYISASYAAALTDPEGLSGKTKPSPYNFFYGPSYSDSMRAMRARPLY